MSNYFTVAQAARKLRTTIELIDEQIQQGRVDPVDRNGLIFLSDRDVYRLKFIFYLQQERRLSSADIEQILQDHRPPYSSWMER